MFLVLLMLRVLLELLDYQGALDLGASFLVTVENNDLGTFFKKAGSGSCADAAGTSGDQDPLGLQTCLLYTSPSPRD